MSWRHVRLKGCDVVIGSEVYRLGPDGELDSPSAAAVRIIERHPNYQRHQVRPAPPARPDAEQTVDDLDGLDPDALRQRARAAGIRVGKRTDAETLRRLLREHGESAPAA